MTQSHILIVDDHNIFRNGLAQLLTDCKKITISAQAADIDSALAALGEHADINLVILDVNLGGKNALDNISDLRAIRPDVPILVMSMYPAEQFAPAAYQRGANGYVTKDASEKQLFHAIHNLMNGKLYIHPDLACDEEQEQGYPHERLSERELNILKFMADGMALTDIGDKMFLSVKTVSTYRTRILDKLHLDNNAELVKYALTHGLSV